jgi:hypothetical protein
MRMIRTRLACVEYKKNEVTCQAVKTTHSNKESGGWRGGGVLTLRGCGDGKDPRREQGAGDPMIGTMIGVEGVREGRTGAAKWVKRNQNGFGIAFEGLQ